MNLDTLNPSTGASRPFGPPESITADVVLGSADWQMQAKLTVPAGRTHLRTLLPMVQSLTDSVVGAAVKATEEQGQTISCQKGCGACCRQLVPIAEVEARRIREVVDEMPQPRRSTILARFAQARDKLQDARLLDKLSQPSLLTERELRSLGMHYFVQGIPCPFLENESCSIYTDRPLACREYLVTSPAENCADPTPETVRCVKLPLRIWPGLARMDKVPEGSQFIRWVPLILAPEWAAAHPEEPSPKPGHELLRDLLEEIAGRKADSEQVAAPPLGIGTSSTPAAGTEVREQKSEVRSQRSGVRGQGSGVREDKAESFVAPKMPVTATTTPTLERADSPAALFRSRSETSEALRQSYEDVPYESKAVPWSHPDTLATMALLHGLQPPPLENCRVLELGSASGGNLIPLAQSFPDSSFLGIDLSPRQIAAGRDVIARLNLRNIDLQPLSILDVDESFGQFDYILCHGVYSWVPPEVQDKILDICRRHLAPQGIAYISYNTYPGWHTRSIIREMMCYHVRDSANPRERVKRARAFLDTVVKSLEDPNTTYGLVLREEAWGLEKLADSYVTHEHLEDLNQPLYFRQFMERAAANGLQYLSEADLGKLDFEPAPEVQTRLQAWASNRLDREQYLDFLRNRTFRRTLLCHAHHVLHERPMAAAIPSLQAAAIIRPKSGQAELDSAAVEFETPEKVTLTTNNPLVKAALLCLADAWPRAVPFAALWTAVRERLAGQATDGSIFAREGPGLLAQALLQCSASDVVHLHVHTSRFTLEVSDRPLANPYARLQAWSNPTKVTTLYHRLVEMPILDGVLLRYLDGTQDRPALLRTLADLAAAGELVVPEKDQPVRDPEKVKTLLEPLLEPSLRRLAGAGLLVG